MRWYSNLPLLVPNNPSYKDRDRNPKNAVWSILRKSQDDLEESDSHDHNSDRKKFWQVLWPPGPLWGGRSKAVWTMLKKTALLVKAGFPNQLAKTGNCQLWFYHSITVPSFNWFPHCQGERWIGICIHFNCRYDSSYKLNGLDLLASGNVFPWIPF